MREKLISFISESCFYLIQFFEKLPTEILSCYTKTVAYTGSVKSLRPPLSQIFVAISEKGEIYIQ